MLESHIIARSCKTWRCDIWLPTIVDSPLCFAFRDFGLKEAQGNVGEYSDHDATVCYVKCRIAASRQHPRNGEA